MMILHVGREVDLLGRSRAGVLAFLNPYLEQTNVYARVAGGDVNTMKAVRTVVPTCAPAISANRLMADTASSLEFRAMIEPSEVGADTIGLYDAF